MKKRIFLGTGYLMAVIAIIFFNYTIHCPEASFLWSNEITYSIYVLYLMITGYMFYMSRKMIMNKKRIFFMIGCSMVAIAITFFNYAIHHTTGSFPWSNEITYSIYASYLMITGCMFYMSRKTK